MNNNYLLYLSGVINEQTFIKESKDGETKNYMFFQNLNIMKKCIDEMLAMNESKVDEMLEDGHDWANDHIAGAKTSLEQVCNWLKNSMDNLPDVEKL